MTLDSLFNTCNSCFQQVLINGQTYDWLPVKACVLPRSTLGPLLYLIYINVLPDDLVLSVKRFAHDTSIFSTVYDAYASRNVFNHDLKKISDWT